MALLRETAALTLGGSKVEWRISTSSEPEQVEADPLQMKEVFHNLLSYAKAITPNGGSIMLTTERLIINADHPIFNEGIMIKITLSSWIDSCFNVKEEFDCSRLASVMRHPGGPELGLALSYAMAKKRDGLLTVQSEVGVGLELILYLPQAQVPE